MKIESKRRDMVQWWICDMSASTAPFLKLRPVSSAVMFVGSGSVRTSAFQNNSYFNGSTLNIFSTVTVRWKKNVRCQLDLEGLNRLWGIWWSFCDIVRISNLILFWYCTRTMKKILNRLFRLIETIVVVVIRKIVALIFRWECERNISNGLS